MIIESISWMKSITTFLLITLVVVKGYCQEPAVQNDSVPQPVLPPPRITISQPVIPQNSAKKVPVWVTRKGPYRPERTRKVDLVHTRLELRPEWQRQFLHGTATLTVTSHFYPQNILELDAKGMEIKYVAKVDTLHDEQVVARIKARDALLVAMEQDTLGHYAKDSLLQVWVKSRAKSKIDTVLTSNEQVIKVDTLPFQYNTAVLSVELKKPIVRQKSSVFRIGYIAKPNERPKGGSEAITDDRGLYFINPYGIDSLKPRQFWTQGETESNSVWFPTIDSPNQKHTQEIYLSIEPEFVTLSNGKLISSTLDTARNLRTDYWRQNLPHAPYLTFVGAGNFAVVSDSSVHGIPVQYYVEKPYAKYAKAIFGRTPEMIRFFEKRFGVPFVWDKYAQIAVRDFVSGAMENTTATVHGESVQKTFRQLADKNDDDVIAHELSHHWFGDLVTCESWGQLPLNESFAAYAEYLWTEHKKGVDEADFVGLTQLNDYLAEADSKQEPLIRYNYVDKEQMFDAHSYQKGARVLHMLRRLVGDEAFFESLKTYLSDNQFGSTEIDDLRKAIETVTGQDWKWFFDQWFLKPGHPAIKVEQNYEIGKLTLTITQTQDTLYTPIYQLPVQIDIWADSVQHSYELVIDKPRQVLEFPFKRRPQLIVFDADKDLLGTVDHEKPARDLVFQYFHSPKFAARYESVTRLEDKIGRDSLIRAMMMSALKDKNWKIRQLAASNFTDYDGQQFVEIELLLQQLAKSDPVAQVRSEAIIALASFADDDNVEIYKQALKDTSEVVASQALDAYLVTKPDDAGLIASRFENSDNPDVVVAVGNYLAGLGEPTRYEWFEKQLNRLNPSGLYQFLPVFGKYLIKAGDPVKKRSFTLLEGIARRNPSYLVRFAAYQVLGLMTDMEGVKSLRRDIRATEKDPKLVDMYKQMAEI
ncbi:MAG: M1 family metallopeptidase [Siphonobacter sp.]